MGDLQSQLQALLAARGITPSPGGKRGSLPAGKEPFLGPRDFALKLRLETPLLQSGAKSRKVDPLKHLRGPSVRGLLHTWARALLGPILNAPGMSVGRHVALTRAAERLLLGAPAGTGGATFRVEVLPQPRPDTIGEYPVAPHTDPEKEESKGKREGHKEDQGAVLVLRPRPAAALRDPGLPAALWAVAWTAFSLGSLGNRSRRGYGSLTILEAFDPPSLGYREKAQDAGDGLPTFTDTPKTDRDLAEHLKRGLELVLQEVKKWVGDHRREITEAADKEVPDPGPAGAVSAGFPFFQLAAPAQVLVGAGPQGGVFPSGYELMQALMDACSDGLAAHGNVYRNTMGAVQPRVPSPLWVRVYRVGDGFLPVATFSPRDWGNTAPAEDVLRAIGAEEVGAGGDRWRTLDTFAEDDP